MDKDFCRNFSISPELFGDVLITLLYSALLGDGEDNDKNYTRYKEACSSLLGKIINLEDEGRWTAFN